jgi:hypothetical protein
MEVLSKLGLRGLTPLDWFTRSSALNVMEMVRRHAMIAMETERFDAAAVTGMGQLSVDRAQVQGERTVPAVTDVADGKMLM